MAMRIRANNGGEVSLSVTDMKGGRVILLVEHRPSLATVLLTEDEAKRLAEALLAAVSR